MSTSDHQKSLATLLLWFFPLSNAIYDTAFTLMATKDFAEEKYDDRTTQYTIMTISAVLAYLQSLKFNGLKTITSMQETWRILSLRTLPDEWPTLTRPQEILAVSMAGLVLLVAATVDFFGADYSVNQTPYDYNFEDSINLDIWNYFAILMGMVAWITSAFTEGTGFYRALREKIAGESIDYTNTYSKLACYLLAYPVSALGAAENLMEGYASVKNRLALNDTLSDYIILGVCTPKLPSDFYFAGKECREAVDAFVGKVTQEKTQVNEAIAFMLSAASAYVVMMPQPYLTKTLMTDPSTALPFTASDALIHSLSYGVTLRDSIVQTYTLYPLFLQATNCVSAYLRTCWQYCYPETQPNLTEQEEPLLTSSASDARLSPVIYAAKNVNTLYQPPSPHSPSRTNIPPLERLTPSNSPSQKV